LEDTHCPNKPNCQVFTVEGFVSSPEMQEAFAMIYCDAVPDGWKSCRRFITKNELHLCPDFVLPDSKLTTDEILDRLENE